MKKRPLSDDGDSTPKPKRGRPRQQSLVLTRYPPLRDTADDSVTILRNIAALQKELERDSPRKDSVLSLCRQTFSKRREEILVDSGEVDATTLLNQFKELHKNYVVRSIDTFIEFIGHTVFYPNILAREANVKGEGGGEQCTSNPKGCNVRIQEGTNKC